ncbi:MAG: hypothetical protein KDC98_24905, partial [Planctomycetes bacterium]|nr:hypothetical protein [Planctomycetota bacterium]
MTPNASFLGTFHKTGTTLMSQVLGGLERDTDLRVWRMHDQPKPPKVWDLCFHHSSRFLWEKGMLSDDRDQRCAFIVRDPRDVVISCVKYHLDAGEEWLHEPDDEFGGATYQQALRSLRTDEERQLFEIDHSAGRILQMMGKIPTGSPGVLVVRLEDLMTDYDLM